MIREEDAAALVVKLAVALKLDGHEPVITAANERRLVWYAALMLDGLGLGGGRDTTEEADD